MPRRYRRRRYALTRPVKTAKYSNETFAGLGTVDTTSISPGYIIFTQSSNVLGTRKTKNWVS